MKYTPIKFNTTTSIDEIGMILDLKRISGEDLFSYKKRLLEFANKETNSSYYGLLNAINNSLGLREQRALKINLKNELPGTMKDLEKNISPKIIVSPHSIILYKNYRNENDFEIDLKIEINDKFKTHRDVVEEINAKSSYFIVNDLISEGEDALPAYTLKNKNSEVSIIKEPLLSSKYIQLQNKNIKYGSVKFSEKTIYQNEVNQIDSDSFLKIQSILYESKKELAALNAITIEYVHDSLLTKPIVDVGINDFNILIKFNSNVATAEEIKDAVDAHERASGLVYVFIDGDLGQTQLAPEPKQKLITATSNSAAYSIDYKNGILKSNLTPSGKGYVSYTYLDFPFYLESSPTSIISFANKDIEKILFNQYPKKEYSDKEDQNVPSQPKDDMIEYITELLKVSNQTWGE